MKTKINGFTMIEAVISIGVLSIVGVIIVMTLGRTFEGSNKTSLIGSVKENGQTALNNMDQAIRGSDYIVCNVTNSSNQILALFNRKGEYIRFKIEKQPTNKSYNGYIQQDMPIITDPKNVNNNLCDFTAHPENNRSYLTDINTQYGVSVVNGSFTLNKPPGYKAIVTVSFDLGPPVNGGFRFENLLGGANVITFKTTVEVR